MSTTQSLIEIIDGSEENLTIQRKRNGFISEIQIRAIELNVHSPNVNLIHLAMIFVYEPETGLFGWEYYELSDSKQNDSLLAISKIELFLEERYIYISNTRIVFFILPIPPGAIWINEFTKKYATNDEAYQECFSILLADKPREIEGEKVLNTPLWKHVKRRFFYKDRHGSVHGESVAKITDVTYHDSLWKIVLESSEKRQTTLILDEDYQVIDVFGDGAIKT
ncbi:MAG TPA: hypothetical protein EYP59_21680 [Thiotrichaceae bacterium]|nr:hypothetical protein [Thiotrichaceae bacterium]